MKTQSKLFTVGLVSIGTLLASGCIGTSANDGFVDLWREVGEAFEVNSETSVPRGTRVEALRDPNNPSVEKSNGNIPMRYVRVTQIEGWVPATVLENCSGQDNTGSCIISNP
jgi:hypothetical protein